MAQKLICVGSSLTVHHPSQDAHYRVDYCGSFVDGCGHRIIIMRILNATPGIIPGAQSIPIYYDAGLDDNVTIAQIAIDMMGQDVTFAIEAQTKGCWNKVWLTEAE